MDQSCAGKENLFYQVSAELHTLSSSFPLCFRVLITFASNFLPGRQQQRTRHAYNLNICEFRHSIRQLLIRIGSGGSYLECPRFQIQVPFIFSMYNVT